MAFFKALIRLMIWGQYGHQSSCSVWAFQFSFACLPALDHFRVSRLNANSDPSASASWMLGARPALCETPSHFNSKRTQIFLKVSEQQIFKLVITSVGAVWLLLWDASLRIFWSCLFWVDGADVSSCPAQTLQLESWQLQFTITEWKSLLCVFV